MHASGCVGGQWPASSSVRAWGGMGGASTQACPRGEWGRGQACGSAWVVSGRQATSTTKVYKMPIHPSIHPSIHPPIHLSTHPSTMHAHIHPPTRSCTHLSTHPGMHSLIHAERHFDVRTCAGLGNQHPQSRDPRTCSPPCPHLADALLPLVVADALDASDQRGGQCVKGKAYIVGLHRAVLPVMDPLVRILHAQPSYSRDTSPISII